MAEQARSRKKNKRAKKPKTRPQSVTTPASSSTRHDNSLTVDRPTSLILPAATEEDAPGEPDEQLESPLTLHLQKDSASEVSSDDGGPVEALEEPASTANSAQAAETAQKPAPDDMADLHDKTTPSESSTAATAVPTPACARDRYGFKRQTIAISEQAYDTWNKGYEEHLARRKKKWLKIMRESGLPVENDSTLPVRFPAKQSEKLKRYVRKGIPPDWRGNAWWYYSKGHEKMQQGTYKTLCAKTHNLKNNDTDLIERDLQRTFPDNIQFRDDEDTSGQELPKISALRRVLTCFSVYVPKIGYCQSLNFIAGMLLLFMDEERTFWMLYTITQDYLPGVHEVNLEGVNVDQGVLMLLVKELMPSIWERVGKNFDGHHYDNFLSKLPPITLCTSSWFMSAFINVLPTETVLRVWDSFFLEGSKVFFRIALTILKLAEPDFADLEDQMEIFQTIQNTPRRIIDPEVLMRTCHKKFGNVSQVDVSRARQFVFQRRQAVNLAALVNNSEGRFGQSTTDLAEYLNDNPLRKGSAFQRFKMKSLKLSRLPSVTQQVQGSQTTRTTSRSTTQTAQ